MTTKKIVFDMDGTIADLYGVENWLEGLRAEMVFPYVEAAPMYDMAELADLLNELKELGYIIAVTSWLAMGGTQEYNNRVRKAKRAWLKAYDFPYDETHLVKYGTPKHYVTKGDFQILVDDNEEIRNKWTKGATINANENIMDELRKLLAE